LIHSLSKLGTFETCAAKYKFRYIDKIVTEQSRSAHRGSETHTAIEEFILGKTIRLPEHLLYYHDFFEMLKRHEGVRPEAKLAMREDWTACAWDDPAVWWRGALDLLIPPINGIVHLYDWKTGKIYDDHEDQRQIYAIGAFAEYPDAEEVKVNHVYTDLGDRRENVYKKNALTTLQARWMSKFKKLEAATEFPYNPQFACRWCPYQKDKGGPCLF
jgi:hypothetical protein